MKTTIPDSKSSITRSCQRRLHGMAATRDAVLGLLLLGASQAFCSTATFVQRDTTTQGTWIHIPTGTKIYGSEGYLMLGSNYEAISALPGYVSSLTYPGFHPYIWRQPDTAISPRDLQLPVAPYTARIAAGWYFWPDYGDTNNMIVLNLRDNDPHLVAMYFEDADSIVRREKIEIWDADVVSDDPLDTQNLDTPFDRGVWLQWKITGSIKIKVILTGPDNTAHMGFFFDPVPPVAYTNWLTRFSFAAGANKTPAGDADGDGMSNQQEFAFGLNPTLGSSANPITTLFAGLTGKFTYTRLAASGLTYTVLTSTDLATWNPAAASQVAGAPDGNGVEAVEVTLTGYSPPVGGKLFVRVQAQ